MTRPGKDPREDKDPWEQKPPPGARLTIGVIRAVTGAADLFTRHGRKNTGSKSQFEISGCAGWTGIFLSGKEKSAGILDVFRACLTPQGGKRPVQTVYLEILNWL